jgi:hypothetical protein
MVFMRESPLFGGGEMDGKGGCPGAVLVVPNGVNFHEKEYTRILAFKKAGKCIYEYKYP